MDYLYTKEVYFGEFCEKCVHEKLEETETPCDECLCEPMNYASHRPIHFKERK